MAPGSHSGRIRLRKRNNKHELKMQAHQISFPLALPGDERCPPQPQPVVLLPDPLYLECPFSLTATEVLGHDGQGVGLLLRFDEDGDSRGCCDLPDEAAHSLRGLLQQGGHVLC